MGAFDFRGPNACGFLDLVTTNDVARLQVVVDDQLTIYEETGAVLASQVELPGACSGNIDTGETVAARSVFEQMRRELIMDDSRIRDNARAWLQDKKAWK